MGSIILDIYHDPARGVIYSTKLRVGGRRLGILKEGKNLLVKGKWNWLFKRITIRLEPVFKLNVETQAFELVGVECPPFSYIQLPRRFKS